jgi:type II restriction/modification system DNA methylase subunit YeeA
MFERMLEAAQANPASFQNMARMLFAAMRSGGFVGFEHVEWFNGGLFDDDEALPLEKEDVAGVLAAARLDWAEIDPSIFGTLFERGLDPTKRSQLGAHYTDRDKINLIIDPVIVRPLMAEWETEKAAIQRSLETAKTAKAPSVRTKARKEAENHYRSFLDRLRAFRVLDPACGSGNFLYLALLALKDLEHRVGVEGEVMGLEREFPQIGPECVHGIEINPYAAELARISVWVGEIQWMRRNGFGIRKNPILRSLEMIECRDALVNPDGSEAKWPESNVIIGNPPFLGDRRMIRMLGESYVSQMRKIYESRVPGSADLVCY